MCFGPWLALLVALSTKERKMERIMEKGCIICLVDHFYGTLKKTNSLLVLYLKLTVFLSPAAGIQKVTYFRDVSDEMS